MDLISLMFAVDVIIQLWEKFAGKVIEKLVNPMHSMLPTRKCARKMSKAICAFVAVVAPFANAVHRRILGKFKFWLLNSWLQTFLVSASHKVCINHAPI